MGIRIGHASIGEGGKGRGGKAGDQTGKEVCIREWYAKNWKYLLRAKDPKTAEAIARKCEEGCANNYIGYDMNERNTAHTEAKKVNYDLSKISVPCETDCSAFMTLCAIAGGVTELEYTGNAPTTSNMVSTFKKTGKFESFTDRKYLDGTDYLKRGDILVKPNSHTVMVLDDGQCNTKQHKTIQKTDDTNKIVREVLAGKWGNGENRRRLLEEAGYNYFVIQRLVNEEVRRHG